MVTESKSLAIRDLATSATVQFLPSPASTGNQREVGLVVADECFAIREFEEETGLEPRGDFIELGTIQQKGGKIVHAWAFAGEWDENQFLQSNTFELEWPPGSGTIQRFPEIDRAGFFPIPQARQKLKEAQHPFLDRLQEALNSRVSNSRGVS